jgi:hypothetical protein
LLSNRIVRLPLERLAQITGAGGEVAYLRAARAITRGERVIGNCFEF